MRYRNLVTCTALALGLMSAAAFAKDVLSGDQIKALISGNTTYGKSLQKRQEGHGFHREDGIFLGWNSSDGAVKGTWRVSGDRYCRKLEGKDEFCNEVRDNGDGTYTRYVQPKNLAMPMKPVAAWTKIAPGNPENLQ